MNPGVIAAIAALIGVLVGAGTVIALSRNSRTAQPRSEPVESPTLDSEEIVQILSALPGAAMLVDSSAGVVIHATDLAISMGLVQGNRIIEPELSDMVAEVHREGVLSEKELMLRRVPLGRSRLDLLARVAPLRRDAVLVLVEDLSGARRVDEVRRDFIANVSHELKTPVGALSLLAEALLSASDDEEAVRHFANRIQVESVRLANLVADLIDLSRLQGSNPLERAEAVSVDAVVAEAIDATRMVAQAEQIEIVSGGTKGLYVYGVESQLATAVRNLLSNAVAYSPEKTRVAIGVRRVDRAIEIAVTDQGIGIPEPELDRIFERFYRVDQARSRITGGTGLGLAIVKHVARNHAGDVSVWSVEGAGSTFTLQLPPYEVPNSESLDLTSNEMENSR